MPGSPLNTEPPSAWQVVFRTMVPVEGGALPACGDQASYLGVRPKTDVKVDASGLVVIDPNPRRRRGMSVAPDPNVLKPMHKPKVLGGESILPCWELRVGALDPAVDRLAVCETTPTHGVVTPLSAMSLAELQTRLCETQSRWRRHL